MNKDSDIQNQVRGLVVLAHGAVQRQVGLHLAHRAGQATGQLESRPYQQGDDLRRFDHRVSARRERPFTKVFLDEAALAVEIVVDTSNSMAADEDKAHLAQQLAVALAVVAASSQDAVGLSSLGPRLSRLLPAQTRVRQAAEVAHALVQTVWGGRGNLAEGLLQLAPKLRQRSIVVILSDCLAPELKLIDATKCLARMGRQVLVGHILSAKERSLKLGDNPRAELIDPENDDRRTVDVAEAKTAYLVRVKQWQQRLTAQLAQAGIPLVPMHCDVKLRANIACLLAARTQRSGHLRRT